MINPLSKKRKINKIINKFFSVIKASLQDKDNSINKLIKQEQPKARGIFQGVTFSLFFININALRYIDSFINFVVKIIIK